MLGVSMQTVALLCPYRDSLWCPLSTTSPFPVYDAQSELYTPNTHHEVGTIPAPDPPLLCKALVILSSTDENSPRALSLALNL